MTTLTKSGIVEREKLLFEKATKTKQDPVWILAEDRKIRWAVYLGSLVIRPEIADWQQRMEAARGAEFRFYNNTVGWIVGLLILRYGEAEYHWPTEGFSEEDVTRAKSWENGKTPDGVFYL